MITAFILCVKQIWWNIRHQCTNHSKRITNGELKVFTIWVIWIWLPLPDGTTKISFIHLTNILLQMVTFLSDCKVMAQTPTVDLALTHCAVFYFIFYFFVMSWSWSLHVYVCVCVYVFVNTDIICPESFLAAALMSTSSSCSRGAGAASSTSPTRWGAMRGCRMWWQEPPLSIIYL